MGEGKTFKKALKDFESRALTIGEVIKILSEFPKDSYLGTCGHFGEFYELDKYDFHSGKSYIKLYTNRASKRLEINVVEIYTQDIGPEPN